MFYASEFKIVYFWDFRSKSWWSNFFPIFIKLLPSSWASIQQKLQFCYWMTGKKSRKMFGFSTDCVLLRRNFVLFMTQISKIKYNLWRFNGFFFIMFLSNWLPKNEKETKKVNEKVILIILFDGFVWICFQFNNQFLFKLIDIWFDSSFERIFSCDWWKLDNLFWNFTVNLYLSLSVHFNFDCIQRFYW